MIYLPLQQIHFIEPQGGVGFNTFSLYPFRHTLILPVGH